MLSRQRGQGDAELQEMQRQHDELDRELEEKRAAIEKGKSYHNITFLHIQSFYFNF